MPSERTAGLIASSRLPDASPGIGEEWRVPTSAARRCAGGGPPSVRPMSARRQERRWALRRGVPSGDAEIFFPFTFLPLFFFFFSFSYLFFLSFIFISLFFLPSPPSPPFFSSIKTMAPSPLKPSLHHHLKQVTTPSFLLAGHLLSQNTKPYLPRGTLR